MSENNPLSGTHNNSISAPAPAPLPIPNTPLNGAQQTKLPAFLASIKNPTSVNDTSNSEQSSVLNSKTKLSTSKKSYDLKGVDLSKIKSEIKPSGNPGDTSRVRDHIKMSRDDSKEEIKQPFSQQRQSQIKQHLEHTQTGNQHKKFEKHPSVELYGRLTARNTKDIDSHIGLRMENSHSSKYLRDTWFGETKSYNGATSAFQAVLTAHKDEIKLTQGEKAILVNSSEVQGKAQNLIGTHLNDKLGISMARTVEIEPGLCALVYKVDQDDGKYSNKLAGDRETEFKQQLAHLGSTPSLMQTKTHLFTLENDDVEDYTPVKNPDKQVFSTLKTGTAIQELRKLDENSPLKPMANAVVSLIANLPAPKKPDHPLVNEALVGMNNMVKYLANHAASPQEFARGMNLLTEELNLYLTIESPYTKNDFEAAADDVCKTRMPQMYQYVQGAYMRGSGMDSISASIDYAMTEHSSKLQRYDLNYFEIPMIVKAGGIESHENQPVIVSSLNPSTPVKPIDHDKLVEEVKQKCDQLDKVTLVLDATLQKNEQELDALLKKLESEIKDGKLNILLCQSYQKYPSLGLGKVKAGAITVINNGKDWNDSNSRVAKGSEQMAKASKPESQLMVHLLKHGHKSEIALFKSASENAKFVHEFCAPPSKNFKAHAPDLPFVLVPSELGSNKMSPLAFFKEMPVEQRDSFGFLQSSSLYVEDNNSNPFFRINTGQESRAGLVERFFALGHLPKGDLADSKLTKSEAFKHINSLHELTKDGLDEAKQHLGKLLNLNGVTDPIAQTRDELRLKVQQSDIENKEAVYKFIDNFMPLYANKSDMGAQDYLENIFAYKENIQASFLMAIPAVSATAKYNNKMLDLINNGMDKVTPEVSQFLMKKWGEDQFIGSKLATKPISSENVTALLKHGDKMAPQDRLSLLENMRWNRLMKYSPEAHVAIAQVLLKGVEAKDIEHVLDRIVKSAEDNKHDKAKALAIATAMIKQFPESTQKYVFQSSQGLLDLDIAKPDYKELDLTKKLNQIMQKFGN